jgi:hypothetical protein
MQAYTVNRELYFSFVFFSHSDNGYRNLNTNSFIEIVYIIAVKFRNNGHQSLSFLLGQQ